MTNLLIYLSASYGLGWLITQSIAFEKLRTFTEINKNKNRIWEKINYLLNCIVCSSFWISLTLVMMIEEKQANDLKWLIPFSSITFTWTLAKTLGDAK